MAAKENQILKLEKNLKKEEHILQGELKKEEKGIMWFFQSHSFRIILLVAVFILLNGAIIYLSVNNNRVYIEKSEINAPIITLSPANAGILDKVLVKEGDRVYADMIVAQVNGVPIKSKIDGLVIAVQNTPGQLVSSQTPIVKMINPNEFRVVGHIQEDKGLLDIKPGQEVIFTVDAFGSQEFRGLVESVVPTARDTSIAFSISDKRPEKEFDVKIRYDTSTYSDFKNGMSAKMWIYK